ncbi:MAG: MlaD family protein [bacterium]
MKLRFRYTGYFVSVFIFTALFAVIVTLGILSIDKRYFAKKFTFYTKFDDAVGLSTSTPIFFKGFKIGQVSSYSINKQNCVDAELTIYAEFRNKIVSNSFVFKTVNPISSIGLVEFFSGNDLKNILPEKGFIVSFDSRQGKELAISNNFELRSSEKLSSIIDNMSTLLNSFSQNDTTKGGILYSTLMSTSEMTKSMKELIERTNKSITVLTGDDYTEGQLITSFKNFAQINKEMGNTSRLMNETLLLTDTLLRAYKNPEGLITKMIDPDGNKIFNPAMQTLNKLDLLVNEHVQFANFLNSQSSQLSIMLAKTNLLLTELRKTIEGLNNNPLIKGGIHENKNNISPQILERPLILEK